MTLIPWLSDWSGCYSWFALQRRVSCQRLPTVATWTGTGQDSQSHTGLPSTTSAVFRTTSQSRRPSRANWGNYSRGRRLVLFKKASACKRYLVLLVLDDSLFDRTSLNVWNFVGDTRGLVFVAIEIFWFFFFSREWLCLPLWFQRLTQENNLNYATASAFEVFKTQLRQAERLFRLTISPIIDLKACMIFFLFVFLLLHRYL